MVDSVDELKSSRSIASKDFPNFEQLDARIASALNKIIQNSHFKKRSQSGGTESSERGSVSSRKSDRLHDVRPLSSAWCSWYSIGLCWFILCCSSWRQYSGKGACYGMKIHQKISKPAYQKLKTMVKWNIDQTLRIRNFDGRNERIVTGAVVTKRRGQRGVERGQRDCYRWKAKGRCSRGHKCSFRHDEDKRSKPTPKTASPSEPPTQRGRSASRKKNLRGQSPSGKFARQPCTKSPCDDWHPPKANLKSQNRVVDLAISARFRTGRLKFNLAKSGKRVVREVIKRPKKGGDRSAVAIVKSVRQLGCVSQDAEPPESATISRKGTKV